MKTFLILLAYLLVINCSSSQLLAQEPEVESWPPDILVVRENWETDAATVERLLDSVAKDFWVNFSDAKLAPVIVYPKGGPITLYKRGPSGEIVIRLNVGKTFWAQYAFQFSHELCHVLSRYDADPHGNDWFEESICELASLYTLRKMGATWKTDPPFEHWKDYAKHLTAYANDRIEGSQLPEGKSLATWYGENADNLRNTGTNRELNNVVAVALLDLFETQPEQWNAIWYLNEGKATQAQSLDAFLRDWYRHAPEKHHEFIESIAARFEIDNTIFDQ
jgi:hypothetical protein